METKILKPKEMKCERNKFRQEWIYEGKVK